MLTTYGNLYPNSHKQQHPYNNDKADDVKVDNVGANGKNPPQVHQVSRHSTSCNNAEKGKTFGMDSEPSLCEYGIINARILAIEQKRIGSKRFQAPSFPIAVSALIRTWETAVLLYGYGRTTRLELRICPWLRETSSKLIKRPLWSYAIPNETIDIGNRPKELTHSIPKFIKFLNKLRSNPNFGDNYKINTINIYIPKIDLNIDDGVTLGSTDADWELLQIHYDPLMDPKIPGNPKGGYKLPDNLCDVTDTIHDVPVYQTEVGDIMKFMEWYESVFGYSPETVHTVAHSTIMQLFIENHIDEDYKSDISEENCWSMTMGYRPIYNSEQKRKIIESIKYGFPNPKKYDESQKKKHKNGDPPIKKLLPEAQALENSQGAASLCGKYGSLGEDKIICEPKKGGRRTRRKRSNRKKTRRHRRH